MDVLIVAKGYNGPTCIAKDKSTEKYTTYIVYLVPLLYRGLAIRSVVIPQQSLHRKYPCLFVYRT